ncbi:MAG: ABC transporter permease [Chloroflexi bacterium]|nr:ABC transporter permease [Chloroflexota bacterium]
MTTPATRRERTRQHVLFRLRRLKDAGHVFAQSRIGLVGIVILLLFATLPFIHTALRATVWQAKMYDPVFGFDQNSMPHPAPPSWIPPDWLADDNPHRFDKNRPSWVHLLGTDSLGRDVLSALMASTMPTFVVGITAALATAVIGLSIAALSAYHRGWVDGIFSHISDAFMMIPAPIFLIAIGIFLQTQRTTFTQIIYLSLTGNELVNDNLELFLQPLEFGLIYGIIAGLGGAAIVLRSHGLKVMSLSFVEASRVAGGQSSHIISRHLIPHMLPLAAIYTLIIVTGAVVANGFLSFFGLNPNPLNWGTMIYNAFIYSTLNFIIPWAALLAPAVAISLFAAAFYMVSLGLNQVVDPHLRADFHREE